MSTHGGYVDPHEVKSFGNILLSTQKELQRVRYSIDEISLSVSALSQKTDPINDPQIRELQKLKTILQEAESSLRFKAQTVLHSSEYKSNGGYTKGKPINEGAATMSSRFGNSSGNGWRERDREIEYTSSTTGGYTDVSISPNVTAKLKAGSMSTGGGGVGGGGRRSSVIRNGPSTVLDRMKEEKQMEYFSKPYDPKAREYIRRVMGYEPESSLPNSSSRSRSRPIGKYGRKAGQVHKGKSISGNALVAPKEMRYDNSNRGKSF